MNVLKAVLKHEVFPALGCTEPIAVAYGASIASSAVHDEIESVHITVDPGVYKNGFAVTVPNTGGQKGNLIAGVIGAIIGKPESKMEILKHASIDTVERARAMILQKKAAMYIDKSKTKLYIEVHIKTKNDTVRAVIEDGHTNLVLLEKNNKTIFEKSVGEVNTEDHEYKSILKGMKISQLVDLALHMDNDDHDYIKQGIEMNLNISSAGQGMKKVGYYISDLMKKGFLLRDIFSSCKILTASAADARMAGLNMPVMSSGGSGNQGIVAILVPYAVGEHFCIEENRVIQSIALSHLINSYIKCYTGDLSPLCGCAIAAGVGAAVAIVFQKSGMDNDMITLAVNNLVSDLGGMLCDGAKGSCALKVASSTDSAIRSAYMAMNNHGITQTEGFVGRTGEETIMNLSEIGKLGMSQADNIMLGIMKGKEDWYIPNS